MTDIWDPPYPKHREPGWFERSSWAERDWRAAQRAYWEERARIGYPWRPDPSAHRCSPEHAQAVADENIRAARVAYRRRILGWYAALCLPLKPGEVVPNRVAELQWEQWDIDGCDAADAVNLGGDAP